MNLPEAAIVFALPYLPKDRSELRLGYYPALGNAQILRIDLDARPMGLSRLIPEKAADGLRLKLSHGQIPATEGAAVRKLAGALQVPVPDLNHVPMQARDGCGYELYLGRYAHRVRCSWWDAQAGPEMESAEALAAAILQAAEQAEWAEHSSLLCREEMERHDSMLNPSLHWMLEVRGD